MDQRTRAVQAWSQRESTQTKSLAERTFKAMWALWLPLGLTGWYRSSGPAAQSAQLAQQARGIAADLGSAYMREVILATTSVDAATPAPGLPGPARNGVDLAVVYDRPAEAYRRKYSVTEDPIAALRAAELRLQSLVDMDLHTARRDAEVQVLRDIDAEEDDPRTASGRAGATGPREPATRVRILGYRRIVHPELSESGVCGLCLAASDRLYTLEELLPIHDRCKCTIAVVTEDYDPAEANEVDLEAIYAAAGGSTAGRDLKKTRWKVEQHGELGPVLVAAGDNFQRQGDAPKGDPVQRAVRELAALEPVLASLERRSAAGEAVDEPLAYQRGRVTKLRAIAAAA